MAPSRSMSQNIRPIRPSKATDDSSPDAAQVSDNSSAEDGSQTSILEDDSTDADNNDASSVDEKDDGVQHNIQNVSFGALKQAQDSLSRKRKRDLDTNPDQQAKLEQLRERLSQIKKAKKADGAREDRVRPQLNAQSSHSESDREDEDTVGSESDTDSSAPSEAPAKLRHKHAPAAQSSRYQVTRKRQVIDVPKRIFRDPRFDAIQQRSAHPGDGEKAYSFLRDYQKDEMQELRVGLKAARTDEDKATLRRKLNSMENRIKARDAKEKEQEILRKHRKEESDRVKSGKTPYFLKRSEIKERVLVDRFEGMKGKDREKVIEKRRMREAQKEKKRMPDIRRVAV